jgi:hypothetical protein
MRTYLLFAAALVPAALAGAQGTVSDGSAARKSPAAESKAPGENGPGTGRTRTAKVSPHLLYTRLEIDRGIVGHTLVAVEFRRGTAALRPLYTTGTSWSRRLLAVARGKLYMVVEENLIQVDLRTGERSLVATGVGAYHQHRSGRLYCRVGERIVVYDFRRGAVRSAVPKPFPMHYDYPRFAVSPDERRIAFPNKRGWGGSKPKDLPGAKAAPSGLDKGFRWMLDTHLVVANLAVGELLRLPTPFASPFPEGGDGHQPPPPLIWQDHKTILVVRGDRAEKGRPTRGLAIVNAETGEMRDVAPIAGDHHVVPGFAVTKDGEVRLTLAPHHNLKASYRSYRIDLKAGRLVEDTRLAPGLDVSHEGGRHLVCAGRRLKGSENMSQVRVSADARRVAWCGSHPNFLHRGLRVFDLATGRLQVVSDDCMTDGLLWAGERDMTAGKLPEVPRGWSRMRPTPMAELVRQMCEGGLPEAAWHTFQMHLVGRTFRNYEQVLRWWWATPAPASPDPSIRVGHKELRRSWPRLAEEVGVEAYEAMRAFVSAGDAAVAFLGDRLKPVQVEAKRIAALIADLDSDAHDVRKRAHEELSRIGGAAEAALRAALEGGPSAEVRARVESLLKAVSCPYPATEESRRAARAARVLERIGTPKAMALLRALSQGAPGVPVTEQARAALERIRKSGERSCATQPAAESRPEAPP